MTANCDYAKCVQSEYSLILVVVICASTFYMFDYDKYTNKSVFVRFSSDLEFPAQRHTVRAPWNVQIWRLLFLFVFFFSNVAHFLTSYCFRTGLHFIDQKQLILLSLYETGS